MPIHPETNEAYHASEGVSKTTLWTLHTKTPYHARYGARKDSHAFDLGTAAHIAILEPERLDAAVMKGPDDRRGNKWKDALSYAEEKGATLLTSGDYDQCMLIRDLADTVPELRTVRKGETFTETSAYHDDEETGMVVKCRPDLYNKTHSIICDIKNMADASEVAFTRDVGKFGYHVQDAMYSDVWANATGMQVDAFFFIVFEKSEPPVVACYELNESARSEGYAVYRHALECYAECVRSDQWPGYPAGVRKIGLRKYDYRLTPAPEGLEGDE